MARVGKYGRVKVDKPLVNTDIIDFTKDFYVEFISFVSDCVYACIYRLETGKVNVCVSRDDETPLFFEPLNPKGFQKLFNLLAVNPIWYNLKDKDKVKQVKETETIKADKVKREVKVKDKKKPESAREVKQVKRSVKVKETAKVKVKPVKPKGKKVKSSKD